MYLKAHLRSAITILENYQGEVPFAAWLKAFFKQNKKYGAKDRRLIADLCFCYFRLGKAFNSFSIEDRIVIGQFLCHNESVFVNELKPEWHHLTARSRNEKMEFLHPGSDTAIFPLADELSSTIDKAAFQLSFLEQPDLFLRVRPGKEKTVLAKLTQAGIPFSQEGYCLRLSNTTKTDELLEIDKEVVVQDLSSQRVLEPLKQKLTATQFTSWDCCAASGGKSILLHDTYPKAGLTVSDVRESILVNLRNRFRRAGISAYQSFVADVSSPSFTSTKKFDVILCDAPCSGSGTWGRTPEQLRFFTREKIDHYTHLQKSIAANASRSLKKGGYFLYITCSVFLKENEDVVRFLEQNCGLQAVTHQYFIGYDKKADTLFAALFTTL